MRDAIIQKWLEKNSEASNAVPRSKRRGCTFFSPPCPNPPREVLAAAKSGSLLQRIQPGMRFNPPSQGGFQPPRAIHNRNRCLVHRNASHCSLCWLCWRPVSLKVPDKVRRVRLPVTDFRALGAIFAISPWDRSGSQTGLARGPLPKIGSRPGGPRSVILIMGPEAHPLGDGAQSGEKGLPARL